LAAAVATVILLACAAPAGASMDAKKVSDRVYARRLCSALAEVVDAEQSFVADYRALARSDLATLHDEATRLADSYLDSARTARAQLEKVQPPGGKKIARLFDTYLATAVRELDAIISRFAKVDPTGPAIQHEIAAFEDSLQSLVQRLPEPFHRLHDKHLLAALRREVTCTDIVQVS
jgi:hypothetical protein